MRFWLLPLLLPICAVAQQSPPSSHLLGYAESSYVIKNFQFRSGQSLSELRLAYVTLGTPQRDAAGRIRNAVLLVHGTGDSHEAFLEADIANFLYGPGQALDLRKFYLVIPDALGHGKSSKPSDGMRARFPNYGYEDMVAAEYKLVTEGFGIRHLRLVMGESMGGMHTWLWGVRYPDMMDGLVPLGCYPVQIAGRNWLWRRVIVEAIRNDPDWKDGDYTKQPRAWAAVSGIVGVMVTSPLFLQAKYPTRAAVDARYDQNVQSALRNDDANDELYAYSASSDYDPAPELEKIRAKLLAINFADDEINPPQLRILEREMPRVKNGRFVIVPATEKTNGHLTAGHAEFWQAQLTEFMESLGGDTTQ
jgi:homoserine O-acetyltransferase/O-succinyltransferase